MKAIVYTSNAGTTKEYAQILGKQIHMPVYSLQEGLRQLASGSEIIYMGWIMASEIKGYKKASKKFQIKMVCGVGMGASGAQIAEVCKKNKLEKSLPVFTLRGGFDLKKLGGVYKLMMSIMVKTAGKALAKKTDRNDEEDIMLDMMLHGRDYACLENLKEVIEWYHKEED